MRILPPDAFGTRPIALATIVVTAMLTGSGAAAQSLDEPAPGFSLEGAWGDALRGMLGGGGDDESGPSLDAPRIPPAEARAAELAAAYDRLLSEDEAVWREAEETIYELQGESGSDSYDLLLARGRAAVERQDFEAALEHLTDLVNLAPEFSEGWHARAVVHYLTGDIGATLDDLADALARDPRHFTAIVGLATVLEEIGDPDRALGAFRLARDVHPNLAGVAESIERLTEIVEGVPI